MRLPTQFSLLCIPPLILALGCGKPRFAYEVDPVFRSGAYQTVAADPRTDRVFIREGMRPLNPELHLRAVLSELEARHYRPAHAQEADLWVATYFLVPGRPEGGRGGPARASHSEGPGGGRHGGGHGGSGGGRPSAGDPDMGGHGTFTLIVILLDRRTELPVWQGEANLNDRDKDSNGAPLSVETAVHQLLSPLAARP
jgi:hypothetical protein